MIALEKTQVKKILILRFGALGDVVHTSCLYQALKKYDAGLSIHYLTFKDPALLIENDKNLESVWVASNKAYKCLIPLAKELRKEKFDLFVNLQPSIRTKVFAFFLKPKRILTYKKDFSLHAVENFWRTAKPVFDDLDLGKNLKLYLSKENVEKASFLLKTDSKKVAFIMETSSARQGRCLPFEYWKDIAEKLIEKYNCEIILTGTAQNIENANKITAVSKRVSSFCGEFNIAESSALLSKCSLVISGDTGPLHIATALGVPVIGLYGSSPVSRTGPWGQNCYTLSSYQKCVPCNRRKCRFLLKDEVYTPCMKEITPEMLLALIENNKLL
jgi:heptosyltransferase II